MIVKFFRYIPLLLLGFTLSATNPPIKDNELVVKDMDNVDYDIDSVLARGQNVALIFWQPWCHVCMREAKGLGEAARTYAETIRFFGVISGGDDDVDDKSVRRVSERFNMPYPHIRDRDLSITKRYRVEGVPTIIILGSEKSVLYSNNRPPKDWSQFQGGQKESESVPR